MTASKDERAGIWGVMSLIQLYQQWKNIRLYPRQYTKTAKAAYEEFISACPLGGWDDPNISKRYWPHKEYTRIKAYAPVIERFCLQRQSNGDYLKRKKFIPWDRDYPCPPLEGWSYYWGPAEDGGKYYLAWDHFAGGRIIFDPGTPDSGVHNGEDAVIVLQIPVTD